MTDRPSRPKSASSAVAWASAGAAPTRSAAALSAPAALGGSYASYRGIALFQDPASCVQATCGSLSRAGRALLANKLALVGLLCVIALVLAALFAPLLAAGVSPLAQDLAGRLAPPGAAHWFGTDELGRDMLARLVYGGRLSLVIGIPSGVLASVHVGRFWDSFGKMFSLLGLSLPSFWVGLVLILFFSVYLGWLPSSGAGTPLHLIMPAFALGWYFAAAHMRLTRSSMLEVLGSEYIKLARIKGLPESLVIAKHAFKNALIPVLTLAGINLVIMINVAVVVETVFGAPQAPPSITNSRWPQGTDAPLQDPLGARLAFCTWMTTGYVLS